LEMHFKCENTTIMTYILRGFVRVVNYELTFQMTRINGGLVKVEGDFCCSVLWDAERHT